ncbi:MAG: hypothetical protein WA140_08555 [Geobacteraceae bacterium]
MKLGTLILILTMSATIPMLPTPCNAATGSARLQVGATVLPFLSFNAAQHVTSYNVRSEDILRGYIDLSHSMTVNIRTNLNGVVPVMIENWGEGKVLVKESGTGNFTDSSFILNTSGNKTGTMISKNYDSRIILPPDAREGVYTLSISMTPAI